MDLEATLRTHGCRVTRPRRVVWEVLAGTDEHLSAQAIADRVRDVDPTVNVSSVYRALTVFAEVGLVRESRIEDTATWERRHGDRVIHLVCSVCGDVIHHDTGLVGRLGRDLARDADFVPDEIDVRVTGTCARCAGRQVPPNVS